MTSGRSSRFRRLERLRPGRRFRGAGKRSRERPEQSRTDAVYAADESASRFRTIRAVSFPLERVVRNHHLPVNPLSPHLGLFVGIDLPHHRAHERSKPSGGGKKRRKKSTRHTLPNSCAPALSPRSVHNSQTPK